MTQRFDVFVRMSAALSGLALIASFGAASAQSLDRLSRADANGDGAIEWQEVLAMRETMFGRLDRNGDGFADMDDRPGFGPATSRFDAALKNLMTAADADGDGRISKTEMVEAPAPAFTSGDTDENGILSADEIAALSAEAG
ncbi:MAG: signal transduction protein [Pseudomonadota bacterium]